MPLRDPRTQFQDFVGRELDDSPATAADHVVVRTLAERVFIVRLLYVKPDLFQDAAVDEEGQRAVDRRLAHLQALFREEVQHLLGFEMLLHLKDRIENFSPRAGILDPPALGILSQNRVKFLPGLPVTIGLLIHRARSLDNRRRIVASQHYPSPSRAGNPVSLRAATPCPRGLGRPHRVAL